MISFGQSKILVYSIQGRKEIYQRETLRVYSNIYTNLKAWCFTEDVEFLYLDSVCIRFIHILQTFTALESWSLLRAVLQLCGLIFNKKNYTLHRRKTSWAKQTCNEVFRRRLAPDHLVHNSRRTLSQRRAAAFDSCLTAGQSLKQTCATKLFITRLEQSGSSTD